MTIANLKDTLSGLAVNLGIQENSALLAADIMLLALLLAAATLAHFITRRLGLFIVKLFVEKSPTRWDDVLKEKKFFSRLANLVPALLIYWITPAFLAGSPITITALVSLAKLYAIVMFTLSVYSFIDAAYSIYQTTKLSSKFAIKGMLQALKLFLFILSTLLILSVLTNKSPIYFLSGLGALTAVMLLVFKDTIMGLVAGIQLSTNDMVLEGDWIEMPQYGADGEVVDVSLTTVKVRNWDKTITTIPTYALISQSVKNWRGMEQSGGRRIKRSIMIDKNSIRFCDELLLKRLSKIQLISGYIKERSEEITAFNKDSDASPDTQVNGRNMTNVGTFRRYIEEYLRHHPKINMDMTFLVRQLQPTDKGLPIEIYVFCNDKRWAQYEAIQADIFDHLFSAIHEFDLRVFQSPTGADFARLGKKH